MRRLFGLALVVVAVISAGAVMLAYLALPGAIARDVALIVPIVGAFFVLVSALSMGLHGVALGALRKRVSTPLVERAYAIGVLALSASVALVTGLLIWGGAISVGDPTANTWLVRACGLAAGMQGLLAISIRKRSWPTG